MDCILNSPDGKDFMAPKGPEHNEAPEEKLSPIELRSLAIVDSNLRQIVPPELPKNYSFNMIEYSGSRPWGLVIPNTDSHDGADWRAMLQSLPTANYLFHELIVKSKDGELPRGKLKEFLRSLSPEIVDYNDVSIFYQKDGSAMIIANNHHFRRDQVESLLISLETIAEMQGDDAAT